MQKIIQFLKDKPLIMVPVLTGFICLAAYPIFFLFVGQYFITSRNWEVYLFSIIFCSFITIAVFFKLLIRSTENASTKKQKRILIFEKIASLILITIILSFIIDPAITNLILGPKKYSGYCYVEKSPSNTKSALIPYILTGGEFDDDNSYYLYLSKSDSRAVRLNIKSSDFDSLKGKEIERFKFSCKSSVNLKYLDGMNFLINWELDDKLTLDRPY